MQGKKLNRAETFTARSSDSPLLPVSSAPLLERGSLAQLGERLICIQEVSGSIPLRSIQKRLLQSC